MSAAEDRLRAEIRQLRGELADAQAEADREHRRYQELAHRVKNEFQQVSALVRMQESRSPEPERCRQCASNIVAFSELHRLLDVTGIEAVSMRSYFHALQRSLELALEGRCSFRAEAEDDIVLPPQTAARLGIVATEAAINAAKHAFPEGSHGHCEARLSRNGAQLQLTVHDDGRGFPGGSPPASGQGSKLIEAFAVQMGGRLDYPETEKGTCVRFVIPGY